MLIAEFSLVQPNLYDTQIPPVSYLSGILMLASGLAVMRSHNVWVRNWPVLITFSGWLLFALGLIRMFTASQY